MSILAALAGTLISAAAVTTAQAETKTLNFGIIATESSSQPEGHLGAVPRGHGQGDGLKVKGFFASDYAGVIEGMRFNKVEAAWFGNKSAMEAVDRAGGEIFAQTVDSEGNPGYWSLILVNKDSPFEKLQDVLKCDKTLNFGMGDPNSTSGFLVPTTYVFAANHVDPKDCFKTVRNANHEANAMAVANKQVDAATNNTENLRRIERTSPEAYKNLKVIWKSPLIPSDPIVWRKDLDEANEGQDLQVLHDLWPDRHAGRSRQRAKGPGALQWAPFKPSSNAQLYPIRQLAINKEMLKIRADNKLSEDQKKAKLAALAKKNDEIAKLIEHVPSM